jgi:hypothetical protein
MLTLVPAEGETSTVRTQPRAQPICHSLWVALGSLLETSVR